MVPVQLSPRIRGLLTLLAIGLYLLQVTGPAMAVERCLALANAPVPGPTILKARLRPGEATTPGFMRIQLKSSEARLTFVGHATFLIESAEGVSIATDYNDYVKPDRVPDIVTMNRAHDSHYTNFPEPGITHVLRGWRDSGEPAEHDIKLRDVRVRNVATHIRGWGGGPGEFGNSIFVFEVGEFCIAHLGHLHHTLNPAQLGLLGQMDVVLVPVDGSYTMDLDGMIQVLKDIKAPLIVPMHYFSRFTLERFLTRVRNDFPVRENAEASIVLTRAMVPRQTEVLVLPGR
jgi:L-ascorbate metabolism protein UlaG (beta-lactamase superfamily)